MGESAFVEIGDSKRAKMMLCIGSKSEVDEASEEHLMRMVTEAYAMSVYRNLESGTYTLH